MPRSSTCPGCGLSAAHAEPAGSIQSPRSCGKPVGKKSDGLCGKPVGLKKVTGFAENLSV